MTEKKKSPYKKILEEDQVPSSAENFRQLLGEGMTADGLLIALLRAFRGALNEFMDAVPREQVEMQNQWQFIALSVAVDNALTAVELRDQRVEVDPELANLLLQVIKPLIEEEQGEGPEGGGTNGSR